MTADDFKDFLSAYGEDSPPQPSNEASIDAQLKALATLIAQAIHGKPEGTVFDVGCGTGILLERLSTLTTFTEANPWIYVGCDFPERRSEVLELAVRLGLHRRADFLSANDLGASWPQSLIVPRPYVFVMRNVLHELDISATALVLHGISTHMKVGEVLLIQDILTFPKAEQNRACWTSASLLGLLADAGFDAFHVEEFGRRAGWITIHATKTKEAPQLDDLLEAVLRRRHEQHDFWSKSSLLHSNDLRPGSIPKIDFDLQRYALLNQIVELRPTLLLPPTPEQQGHLTQLAFLRAVEAFDAETIVKGIERPELPEHFRDRARGQDRLEEFLRGDKSVAPLYGGAFMGKSVLVQAVLHHRAQNRQSIFIDCNTATTVWSLIEQFSAAIGCQIPAEISATYSSINFSTVEESIFNLIRRSAGHTVVVFDHFEDLLDPDGKLTDPEVTSFIREISNQPDSKVIITSRREIDWQFLPRFHEIVDFSQERIRRFPVRRAPNEDYVTNVLDDFVDRERLGITDYPDSLIKAIDRTPYLAILAGEIIKKEGSATLSDGKLLKMLEGRLRKELLSRIISTDMREVVEFLSIIRVPIPRKMVINVTNNLGVQQAEEMGLFQHVVDKSHDDLVVGLPILRGWLAESVQLEDQNPDEPLIDSNEAVQLELPSGADLTEPEEDGP